MATTAVPKGLLLDRELPVATKLVWMAGADRCGLSRPTVRKSLAQLEGHTFDLSDSVPVPPALLENRGLSAAARVLYGILLLLPDFRHPGGSFTYAELAGLMNLSRNPVAQAVAELEQAEWIKVEQAHRRDRMRFELTFPGFEQGMVALAKAQRRLNRPGHVGQALMWEYLSLLVASDEWENEAEPWFLENPRTEERMHFDRFYPPAVAFEFHGPQHFRATAKFSEAEVAAQRERDYIKMGICVSRGISLVIVQAEDLTLAKMRAKVGNLLPLRDLTGYDLLIDYLETESLVYRQHATRH